MAQEEGDTGGPGLRPWKAWFSTAAAVPLALLFIIAGVWKITDPLAASVRMEQALVPPVLALPAAIGFGVAEVFAGTLLLAPRLRRWGAWLAALLLVAFVVYIAAYYGALRGEDCNCFPWIRRAVGPAFFVGDALMLLMAAVAGVWARPSRNFRSAAIVLVAVCVFAGVSYGVVAARGASVTAPEYVSAAGEPVHLRQGRVFLFFFNPECLHCYAVARELSRLDWGQTRIVAVSTQLPEFAQDFLHSTGLQAVLSPDAELLKKTFAFVDVPYGVALESGTQRAAFTTFESAPAVLRKLGFVR